MARLGSARTRSCLSLNSEQPGRFVKPHPTAATQQEAMNEFRNVQLPVPFATPAAAKYSNNSLVLFSPWEFSFELSQVTPFLQGIDANGQPQVQLTKVVHDWISMSPPHAKAFLKALADNVERIELASS